MSTARLAYPMRRGPALGRYLDVSSAFTQRALLFLLAHVPLALALKQSSLLATAHALGVFAYGMLCATSPRRVDRVVYVVSYIAGAELLWRMTRAHVLYEFGKYSAAAVMLVAIAHARRASFSKVPVIYFLLLLPSCVLAADRQAISFNLSGPFSLAVATVFFSRLRVAPFQMRRILLFTLAPIVSLVFLASFSTLTTQGSRAFTGGKVTSGGVGPNQMSSMLGLGALIVFLYLLIQWRNRSLKYPLIAVMVWMIGQCALTYSRGGLWSALLAMAVASFFLLPDRRLRLSLIFGSILFALVSHYVLLPALDRLSEGTLMRRLQSFDPTGRETRAQAEIETFRQNPILGIGPGAPRLGGTFEMTAHTEYTRLLAEHGALGLVSLLLLLGMGLERVVRRRRRASPMERVFSLALTAWAYLFMGHAAMRLFAPSFAFGLAAARLLPGDPGTADARRGAARRGSDAASRVALPRRRWKER